MPDGRCKKAPRCLKSKCSENINMKKPSRSWVSEEQEQVIAPSQWKNSMKQLRCEIKKRYRRGLLTELKAEHPAYS